MFLLSAPGGSLQQEAGTENGVSRCPFCVFATPDDPTALRAVYEVCTLCLSELPNGDSGNMLFISWS
jgi:hypothetical protein